MGIKIKSISIPNLCRTLTLSLALLTGAAADFLPVTDNRTLESRQVFVLNEKGELTGISWTGRMAVVPLKTNERILKSGVGKTIAIYATNKRYLGYSGERNRWYYVNRSVSEKCTDLRVKENNGLVLTNQRVLTFNGSRWTSKRRR